MYKVIDKIANQERSFDSCYAAEILAERWAAIHGQQLNQEVIVDYEGGVFTVCLKSDSIEKVN